MSIRPSDLKLVDGNQLRITWDDQVVQDFPIRSLRENCPCASCREKRQGESTDINLLPVLQANDLIPLALTALKPMGNYAYAIEFSDGHDTGIYTLEFLRELGAHLAEKDCSGE